jgi:hypothetical protein
VGGSQPPRGRLVTSALEAVGISDPRATLENLPWSHRTATFNALGRTFCVRTTDARLGHYIDDVLAGMAWPGTDRWTPQCDDCYSIFAVSPMHQALYREDEQIRWSASPGALVEWLIWDVNQHATRSHEKWVKLHAGVVDRAGQGVILPAPTESGKSTLTAGLLLRGYRYLSDEIAAIRVDDGHIDAYPKPLGLDKGSWLLLPEFAPDHHRASEYSVCQWQVPPRRFPNGTVDVTTPRLFILPTYEAHGGTRLETMTSAEATAAVTACAFAGEQARVQSVQVIARVVATSACFRLQHDDLDDACRAIDEVVAQV